MYRVMIVDDEEVIVKGLVHTMPWAQHGCEVVTTASDGIQALEKIRKEQPDILFTDICMPGRDGLALIAAVRSEFPAMQVTILSGYPNFEYAQRAIDLGVTRYLLKPSKFAQLLEALQQMVQNLQGKMDEPAASKEQAPAPLSEEEGGNDKAQNFIVKNAIEYIEQHYADHLTLADVADHVYVSQWHLSKLISRYTEQSFFDLLNGVRVERAKELLRDPALKVWEISEKVGFTDATHFSRIFKKHTGMSANEFRSKQ